MPKKKVSTYAHAPALALIDAAKRGPVTPAPSPEGIEALRKLIEYNDANPSPRTRVSATAAVKMLRDHYGWTGGSIQALNSLCARTFGRKSWGVA